jgi:hypothetical protein
VIFCNNSVPSQQPSQTHTLATCLSFVKSTFVDFKSRWRITEELAEAFVRATISFQWQSEATGYRPVLEQQAMQPMQAGKTLARRSIPHQTAAKGRRWS